MELQTEHIDVVSYWPGILQTDEILAGSVDLTHPRRGLAPGLELLFPRFSDVYHSALAETLLFAGRVSRSATQEGEAQCWGGMGGDC